MFITFICVYSTYFVFDDKCNLICYNRFTLRLVFFNNKCVYRKNGNKNNGVIIYAMV